MRNETVVSLGHKFTDRYKKFVGELVKKAVLNKSDIKLPTLFDILTQPDDFNVDGFTSYSIFCDLTYRYISLMWGMDIPRNTLISRVTNHIYERENNEYLNHLCDIYGNPENPEDVKVIPDSKESPERLFTEAVNNWVRDRIQAGNLEDALPFLVFAEQCWMFHGAGYWYTPNNRKDAVYPGRHKLYKTDPTRIIAQNFSKTKAAKEQAATPTNEEAVKLFQRIITANLKDTIIKTNRVNATYTITPNGKDDRYTIKSASSDLKKTSLVEPPEIVPHMVVQQLFKLLKDTAEKTPLLVTQDTPMMSTPKQRVLSFDYALHERYRSASRKPIAQALQARAYMPVLGAPRYTLGMTRVDAFSITGTRVLTSAEQEHPEEDNVGYWVSPASNDLNELVLERISAWGFDRANNLRQRNKPAMWRSYLDFFRNAHHENCRAVDETYTPAQLQGLIKYLSREEKVSFRSMLPPEAIDYARVLTHDVFNVFEKIEIPEAETAVAARKNFATMLRGGIYKVTFLNQSDKLNSVFCTLNWNILDFLCGGRRMYREPSYFRVLATKIRDNTDQFSNDSWFVSQSGELMGSGVVPDGRTIEYLKDCYDLRLSRPELTLDKFWARANKNSVVYEVSLRVFKDLLRVAEVDGGLNGPADLLYLVSQVEHCGFTYSHGASLYSVEDRERELVGSDVVTVRNVFAPPFSSRNNAFVQVSARKVVDVVRVAKPPSIP